MMKSDPEALKGFSSAAVGIAVFEIGVFVVIFLN